MSVAPMPFTAAMIVMLMPTAMRAYSIAVAPDSSLKKILQQSTHEETPVAAQRDSSASCAKWNPRLD